MILALLTVRADDVNPPAATQYRNLDNAAYLANHTGVINDATITNNFSIKIPALGGSLPFVKGDILKIKCYVNAYHYETMEPNSNVVESDDHTLDGSDFNGELIVPIPAPRFAGFCAGQDTGIHLGTVRVDYVIRDPNTNKTKAMPKHTQSSQSTWDSADHTNNKRSFQAHRIFCEIRNFSIWGGARKTTTVLILVPS
ncbi:hypothetical protein [Ochrobactrum teleogrylli]